MADLTKEQQQEVKKEVEKQVVQEKKRISKQLFEKSTAFGSEFKKQISTALLTAFGLVIALSWQDLIKSIMENAKPETTAHPYLAALYTAIVVTFFAVMAMMVITRWAKKPETKK